MMPSAVRAADATRLAAAPAARSRRRPPGEPIMHPPSTAHPHLLLPARDPASLPAQRDEVDQPPIYSMWAEDHQGPRGRTWMMRPEKVGAIKLFLPIDAHGTHSTP